MKGGKFSAALLLLAALFNLLVEAPGSNAQLACLETNMQVTQTLVSRQGTPIVETYQVEVSTDCSCSGASSVVLYCGGLDSSMLADPSKLRIRQDSGLCFLVNRLPITSSSPYSFAYTARTSVRLTVASASFNC